MNVSYPKILSSFTLKLTSSVPLNLRSYRSVVTPTLHEAHIQLCKVSEKRLIVHNIKYRCRNDLVVSSETFFDMVFNEMQGKCLLTLFSVITFWQ